MQSAWKRISGLGYLFMKDNPFNHSSILQYGIIQLIECDNQEKAVIIKTRSQNTSKWNEMQLDKLQIEEIIYLNEKEER